MKDYVLLATTDVVSAVNSASARQIATFANGQLIKGVCLDNGFDVDMVVMIDDMKPVYLRAGDFKVLDLSANAEQITSQMGTRVMATYAAAGIAPSTGTFLIDCMF